MINFRTKGLFPVMAIALAGVASPAMAADEAEETKAIDVEVTLAGFSDYRFRGLSLSGIDPAFQPEIVITHESGIYGSIWGSNVSDNGGDDIEVDLVAGIARDIGNVTVDVNATYYLYPGAGSTNYIEFIGNVSTPVGPGSVGLTVAYAPSQSNIGNQDNVYFALDGSVPISGTPLTLTGSFGFEDGAFGDSKKDWSLGVTADVAGFTLGAAYVDTAHASNFGRIAKAGAVFSISRTF